MTSVRYSSTPPSVAVVKEGETYTTGLLPGFELRVGDLFREADLLEDAQAKD